MYKHIQTYTNIYKHIQICTNIYKHIQAYTNMYKHIQTYTNIYKHIQICTNIYKHIQTYTNMYKHIQTYIQVKEIRKVAENDLTVCLTPHEDGGSSSELTKVDCILWAVGRDANDVKLGLETTVSNLKPLLVRYCELTVTKTSFSKVLCVNYN